MQNTSHFYYMSSVYYDVNVPMVPSVSNWCWRCKVSVIDVKLYLVVSHASITYTTQMKCIINLYLLIWTMLNHVGNKNAISNTCIWNMALTEVYSYGFSTCIFIKVITEYAWSSINSVQSTWKHITNRSINTYALDVHHVTSGWY